MCCHDEIFSTLGWSERNASGAGEAHGAIVADGDGAAAGEAAAGEAVGVVDTILEWDLVCLGERLLTANRSEASTYEHISPDIANKTYSYYCFLYMSLMLCSF